MLSSIADAKLSLNNESAETFCISISHILKQSPTFRTIFDKIHSLQRIQLFL